MASTASRRSSLLALALLLLPSTASALDTWEGYGPLGFGVDVFVRGGVDPDGGPRDTAKGELGGWAYGYAGLGAITLYGRFLVDADPAVGLDLVGGGPGIYASPVDTAVFDLDLGFEFLFLGPDAATLTPTPWLELNLDFGPDQSIAGLFGQLYVPIYITPAEPNPDVALEFDWLVGAYFALAKKHQLLVGWRNNAPVMPAGHVEPGEVAVGWNAKVAPFLELISEVSVGIPDDESLPSIAGTIGLEIFVGGKP